MKWVVMLILIFCPLTVKGVEEVSSSTKYYKTISYVPSDTVNTKNVKLQYTAEITEQEYESGKVDDLSSLAVIETTYKKMVVTIFKNGNYYRYQNVLYWTAIPKIRSYDIIGIGFYRTLQPKGSAVFSQYYCYAKDDCYLSYDINNRRTSSGGVGISFKLPSGNLTELKQTIYVDMQKNTDAEVLRQVIVGDYAHAQNEINLAEARKFDMNLAGIYTYSYLYDDMGIATLKWEGCW